MENEKRLIYAEDALEAEFSIEAYGAIGFVVDSEVIRRLPTVDAVEVVHGYWKREVEDGVYWYVCSECGNEVPKSRWRTDYFSDYCPNCGAMMDMDMDGGEYDD